MKETEINLGQGLKTNTWTFNGMIPGPTLEVCVGDKVTIHLANNGSVAHGLDTHAFRIDARKFGPIEPEEIIMIEATVDTPGVYMYHCAAGPITDQHIKMNMSGVMIVYDRNVVLPPAKEIAVLRGAVFGTPDDSGMIYSDSKHMDMNAPDFYMFNGFLEHQPLAVKNGEMMRVYFVNAAPGVASFHVIGTILDRVFIGGNPRNVLFGIQTIEVGSGNGTMAEFTIPEEGAFLIVDHNQLAHIPDGFVMPILGVK